MPRSTVLTARIDARDRAQQRHRRDRRPEAAPDPVDALWRFIDVELARLHTIEDLETYDLTDYVRRSGAIDVPPAERLRKLAIALEDRPLTHALPRRHRVIDRVYAAALRIDPDDAQVWGSRGVTAGRFFTELGTDAVIARRLEQAGRRALQRAMELDPDDAHYPWILGHLVYHSRHPGKTEEALRWFERALALDRKHASALLYRAHCLHDLKRWRAAIDAYDAVPLGAFVGPRAWIADYLVEMLGDCRLHAGDREGALADFGRVMRRYELQPGRAAYMDLFFLRRAAEGELRVELDERYAALCEKLGWLPRAEREDEDDDREDDPDGAEHAGDDEQDLPDRDR